MSEGRIILVVFALAGLVMLALPVSMLLSANRVPEKALDGEVAQFFIASERSKPQDGARYVLPGIVTILPAGLSADSVFQKMAASGFTCVPDARSASCFRAAGTGCGPEWRVSLVFDAHDVLKLSEADRRTTCL